MVYTTQNPKGIDEPIQRMQIALNSGLNWADIDIYGRVYENPTDNGSATVEAYVNDGEYKDVFTNDNIAGTIFFVEGKRHESTNGIKFSTDVSIIFMLDLKKLYPGISHRPDMEAEMKAIEVVRNQLGFEFKRMDKGVEESLRGIDTDYLTLTDMQPWHVFSLTGKVNYTINCF